MAEAEVEVCKEALDAAKATAAAAAAAAEDAKAAVVAAKASLNDATVQVILRRSPLVDVPPHPRLLIRGRAYPLHLPLLGGCG